MVFPIQCRNTLTVVLACFPNCQRANFGLLATLLFRIASSVAKPVGPKPQPEGKEG